MQQNLLHPKQLRLLSAKSSMLSVVPIAGAVTKTLEYIGIANSIVATLETADYGIGDVAIDSYGPIVILYPPCRLPFKKE